MYICILYIDIQTIYIYACHSAYLYDYLNKVSNHKCRIAVKGLMASRCKHEGPGRIHACPQWGMANRDPTKRRLQVFMDYFVRGRNLWFVSPVFGSNCYVEAACEISDVAAKEVN